MKGLLQTSGSDNSEVLGQGKTALPKMGSGEPFDVRSDVIDKEHDLEDLELVEEIELPDQEFLEVLQAEKAKLVMKKSF